jgi:2-polyprenyl-6-methoxyphenol hydroxylase-like FAD-dependent oxidoreductase
VNVVVAGGGIAGLATAIALRSGAHEVQVLEQASAPVEIGAGLAIWPNGRRALAKLVVGVPAVPCAGYSSGDGVTGCSARRSSRC